MLHKKAKKKHEGYYKFFISMDGIDESEPGGGYIYALSSTPDRNSFPIVIKRELFFEKGTEPNYLDIVERLTDKYGDIVYTDTYIRNTLRGKTHLMRWSSNHNIDPADCSIDYYFLDDFSRIPPAECDQTIDVKMSFWDIELFGI